LQLTDVTIGFGGPGSSERKLFVGGDAGVV